MQKIGSGTSIEKAWKYISLLEEAIPNIKLCILLKEKLSVEIWTAPSKPLLTYEVNKVKQLLKKLVKQESKP